MKTAGKNVCAMSEDCEGKDADRGMMCAEHRAEDEEMRRVAFISPSSGQIAKYIAAMANMQRAVDKACGISFDMIARSLLTDGESIMQVNPEGVTLVSRDEFYCDIPDQPPTASVGRDHGHPQSPKASRRKGG